MQIDDQFRMMATATLLRRVVTARARGDWREAEAEWHSCVARGRERVENVVGRYYRGTDPDMVVQLALIRATKHLIKLEKLDDENSFFAAVVRAAKHQCMDSNRSEQARRKHEPGSIDAPISTAEPYGTGRYDKAIAANAETEHERDEEIADAKERFKRALAGLKDERRRAVVLADLVGGVSDDDLAARLNVTKPNLWKIRERAYKDMRGLLAP